jgi:hypothetical protein
MRSVGAKARLGEGESGEAPAEPELLNELWLGGSLALPGSRYEPIPARNRNVEIVLNIECIAIGTHRFPVRSYA